MATIRNALLGLVGLEAVKGQRYQGEEGLAPFMSATDMGHGPASWGTEAASTTTPTPSWTSTHPSEPDPTQSLDPHRNHFEGTLDLNSDSAMQMPYTPGQNISVGWQSEMTACQLWIGTIGNQNAALLNSFSWCLQNSYMVNTTSIQNVSSPDGNYYFTIEDETQGAPVSFKSQIFAMTASNSTLNDSTSATNATATVQPSAQETPAPAPFNGTVIAQAAFDSYTSSGLSTNSKIAIGVGVGLGVPIIAAAIAGLIFMLRRKKAPTDPNPGQFDDHTPSHESIAIAALDKGMRDDSPPLPPLPPQSPAAEESQSHRLPALSTMVSPATGADPSPISPLTHRSSISSISTLGPNTRPTTMASEHHHP